MTIEYDPEETRITWPDGIYQAHIENAEEKTSKAGNQMIEFTFVCFDRQHGVTRVWDHVVIPRGLWKLKALADVIGNLDAFGSGVFRPEDYIGAHLRLELNTERSKGYPPKNVVVEVLEASDRDDEEADEHEPAAALMETAQAS